ncbi:hypothetical protein D3C76_1231320 [compost metagenome]
MLFHFSIISLHAGPVNPISVKLKSFSDAYVGSWFQQNWHLFAPDPLTNNYKLYVRIKYTEEATEQSLFKTTGWYDATSPMIEENNKSLFSPFNKMLRISMGHINGLHIGGSDDLTLKVIEKKMEEEELDLNTLFKDQTSYQKESLYRLALAYSKKNFPNTHIQSVQIMTSTTEAVPYSKRNDKTFKQEEKFTVFEWKDDVKDVIQIP